MLELDLRKGGKREFFGFIFIFHRRDNPGNQAIDIVARTFQKVGHIYCKCTLSCAKKIFHGLSHLANVIGLFRRGHLHRGARFKSKFTQHPMTKAVDGENLNFIKVDKRFARASIRHLCEFRADTGFHLMGRFACECHCQNFLYGDRGIALQKKAADKMFNRKGFSSSS